MTRKVLIGLTITVLLVSAWMASPQAGPLVEAGRHRDTIPAPIPAEAPPPVSPEQSTTCNSCADCTSKLASGQYTLVTLNADISEQFGSCVSLLSSANSNLTFDCNGHTIDGDDIPGQDIMDAGIEMMYGTNNAIRNCTVTDFDVGIHLRGATDHTVQYNTLNSNVYGIHLEYADSNTLDNLHTSENYNGIMLSDSSNNQIDWNSACRNTNLDFNLVNSSGNTGDDNRCDKPDGWNDQGTTGCSYSCAGSATCSSCADCSSKLDGTYQTVTLADDISNAVGSCVSFGGNDIEFNCNGHTIDGDDADNDNGILISGNSGNSVRNCVITDFNSGIFLSNASGSTIDQNTVDSNTYAAIYLQNSSGNTVSANQGKDNGSYALYLDASSNNQLYQNMFRCNAYGIVLSNADSNSLVANTVCSNPGPDMYVLGTSSGNSGASNVCDSVNGWNDSGATGCTFLCNSQRCGTCSDGVQGANEDGVDCGGTYCPPCSQCTGEPTNKYAPHDTVCNNKWPTTDGHYFFMNTLSYSCNTFEVCNPDLDFIIEDALLCCEYSDYSSRLGGDRLNDKIAACGYAHTQAYRGNFATLFNQTTLKQCMAHYIIRGLDRSGVYMQGYFYGELCCFGHGLCPSGCTGFEVDPAAWEMGNAGNCRGKASKSPDFQMDGHRCFFQNYGLFKLGWWGWWDSDTAWQSNSDSYCDVPTHASINRLSTGTCVDYSYALTTLLRKAGYSKDDVLSVQGKGHAYNLVRFPGEAKWHYVDTTGNTAGGVFGGSGFVEPTKGGYRAGGPFQYCGALTGGCVNDITGLSKGHCPANTMIVGCEWVPQPLAPPAPPPSVAAGRLGTSATPDAGPSTDGAIEQICTELNPCPEEHTAVLQPPGPQLALEVIKETSSRQIVLGQELQVSVRVENYESTSVAAVVGETFVPGVYYQLDPQEETQDGLTVQYYLWDLQIPPSSSETVVFTVVPSTTGVFDLGATSVVVGGRDYWTTAVSVTVTCNPNGFCDPGENYLLCPEDCLTGIQDDLCDMVADDIQDPDCAYGVDPDYYPFADTDGDGILDGFDYCTLTPAGAPVDDDGCACGQKICDDEDPTTVERCDDSTAWCAYLPDADQDEVPDSEDNCPDIFNPGQEDSDNDGTGDQCEIGLIDSDTTLEPGTYYIDDPEMDGAITIVAPDVVLDCNGATIYGAGQGYGVYAPFYASNVTIRNCTIENYRYGIFVDSGAGSQISSNTLRQNGYGIVLGYAMDNFVSGNTTSGNAHAGIYLEASSGNQIDGNTVFSNRQIGVFIHTSDNNDISNNVVCNNMETDFSVYNSDNTGDNNTCDLAGGWNDQGTTGCTSTCGYQRVYLPVILKR